MTGAVASLPLTTGWSSAPARGRVLFVAFAYHGADGDGSPRGLLERREAPQARGHRIVHRDHYANPRRLPYLMGLMASAIEQLSSSPPDLVVDRRLAAEPLPEPFARLFAQVKAADVADPAAWTSGPLAGLGGYTHVVLVYSDALGLGCGAAERQAVHAHPSVLVINGRRRAFRLDARLHRRLGRHRALAHTRVVERLMGTLLGWLGAALAIRDGFARGGHE